MSVGISQVGFDPKVLEDEEEAVYQQEEKEREQEIRNLIINELDDNLLDDDNASFSSHDYRSTSNSRASQQLDDSGLHTKDNDWNSNEYVDFPPRRGVFEKPSLMTERATGFIGQTDNPLNQQPRYGDANSNNQQPRYGEVDDNNQQPRYGDANSNNQQPRYGEDDGNNQQPRYGDANSNNQQPRYGEVDGNNQQPRYSQGDVDGNNQQPRYSQGDVDGNNYDYQEYEDFGSYHGNSTDTNSNGHDDVTNHNNVYNASVGYQGLDIPDQHNNNHGYYGDSYPSEEHYGNHHDPPETHQREASFPGNYRVQYVPGYRPQNVDLRSQPSTSIGQHSPNTVWRDLRTQDPNSVQSADSKEEFIGHTTNTAQLQVLYQARGRKIEELSEKLNEREEELGRQIRVLNHQLVMLKDDHQGLSESLTQSQQIVSDKQQEIKMIQDKLNTSVKDNDLLKKEKLELLDKFTAANSTIDCLNEQLAQLSRADSLAKAREQHETILNTVRQRQEDDILRLKQKLDDSQVALNWKTEEASRLRGEMMEKADIINRLNRTLDDSQRQCQELLKTGTVTEITNLRTQLQDTISSKTKVDLNCTSLKSEVNGLKEELTMYQNALKYGYGDQTTHNYKGEDVVRNLNSENWATPKTHGNTSQMDAVNGLRKELDHSLSLNQTKTKTIKDLEKTLEETTEQLNEEKKKVKRLEKIVVEQEVKVNTLKTQLNNKSGQDDPDSDIKTKLQDLEEKNQELKDKLEELQVSEQQLSEDNLNLKTHMAEMVAEFDEDKRISLDKCRDACLQLHEDAKHQLRQHLEEEKELALKALRDDLQEANDELVRVKESYLVLSEESRAIEKRIRDEMKQTKGESQAVEAMKVFIENQHKEEMERSREQWNNEQKKKVTKLVNEQTENITQQLHQKTKEFEKKLQESENSHPDNDNRLAAAKREWIQEHEQDMIKRISLAVNEARKTWREMERKNINEQVEKAVNEIKKTLKESHDQEMTKALSEARDAWKKEEEDTKLREIEHEVEVAVTNAVAEAKQMWDRTNIGHSVQQTIESTVALAEVKWLEQEQVKISRAVDTAVQAAKSSWAHDKQREIARAVSDARQQWQANQDQELSRTLEEASAQLVDKFDEQKREAVEMALREAKTLWQRHYDQNNNLEAIRSKLWSEFEDTKRQELQETMEEERSKILQHNEELNQEEINRAISYMESQYAKSLEEFKHKELRSVLAEARTEWEKEQESEVEEIVKKRIDIARDEWFQSLDNSSRTEVDRALATAREAWAAEYEDELEDRVNAEVDRARENIRNEMEETIRTEIDEAVRNCRKQFEGTERRLKDEINRLKMIGSPQSLRRQYEQQISNLKVEHQQDYDRLREEHDEHTRMVRESVEEEFDQKLVAVLHDAKQVWEEEQEEDRIQVEDQHNQKIKTVLENARQQFLKDQEKAVNSATDAASNRQKDLLKIEKDTHKLTVERMKEELTKTKQNHEEQLQLIARKHADEIKNLNSALNGKTDNGTQNPPKQNSYSVCDSSIGSIDQLTAMRTMHELRDSYLDTVAKIRHDVLDHVNQTKTNAAKKIRSEVLKERHSTAKKLRRYYLQCLKQLLEEDKACSEMNKPSTSVEDKLERMSKVLHAISPEPTSNKDQPSSSSKEPHIINGPSANKLHSRPGGYGPDGASDSPRPSPSDKPQGPHELPVNTNKQAIIRGDKTITLWPEKDRPSTEHVTLKKPPSVQRRFAGSPALSVTSLESEQYTNLPSVNNPIKTPVISVAKTTTTSPMSVTKTTTTSPMTPSKLDEVKARAFARNNEPIKPISISAKQRRTGPLNQGGVRLRDRYIKNTSPLPPKPNVHINERTPTTD